MLVKFLSTSPLTEKSRLSDVLEKSWKSWYLERGNCHTIDRCTEEKKKEKRHKKIDAKNVGRGISCHKQETARVTSYPKKKWLLLGCFVVHFPGSGSDKGTIN